MKLKRRSIIGIINPFTVKRKETFRAKSVLKKKVFKIA